jgi:hypothetical protein
MSREDELANGIDEVPPRGLEPLIREEYAPKAYASTNCATGA